MLIRNITSRMDRAVQQKKQDELLRIQMANQANISKARKDARDGVLVPPTEDQMRSTNETAQTENEISQRAQDNLLQLYTLSKTRAILTGMSIEEKRFMNTFWVNFKKQFEGIDSSMITPPMFLRLLKKYISDTISQKGLGPADVNEPSEMRSVVPSRAIVRRILPNLARFFPDEQTYDYLNQQSEANQERFVKQLMLNYRNISPLVNWLQPNPDLQTLAPFLPFQRRNIVSIFQALEEEPMAERARSAEPSRMKRSAEESRGRSVTPLTKAEQDTLLGTFAEMMRQQGRYEEVFPRGSYSRIKSAKKNNPARREFFERYGAEMMSFQPPTKSGRGMVAIEPTHLAGWIHLGKVKYNNKTLNEKQTLSVKSQGGGPVAGFERIKPVSNIFIELMDGLTKTKKVDSRILKELDGDEKNMFERMIQKSGLSRDLGITVTPSDEDKKMEERFNLVKGSYLAGNSSKELKEELRSLILRFIRLNKIDRRSGLATLQEIV